MNTSVLDQNPTHSEERDPAKLWLEAECLQEPSLDQANYREPADLWGGEHMLTVVSLQVLGWFVMQHHSGNN